LFKNIINRTEIIYLRVLAATGPGDLVARRLPAQLRDIVFSLLDFISHLPAFHVKRMIDQLTALSLHKLLYGFVVVSNRTVRLIDLASRRGNRTFPTQCLPCLRSDPAVSCISPQFFTREYPAKARSFLACLTLSGKEPLRSNCITNPHTVQ